ncbi:HAMP domain-containing histidine kinase (plasmid) [Skermanella rosea]|uniref:ATP-binding protein n=1 Tax=Skermanella rosea TaxID=1817965 RepID=UPI0019340260|nr:HAMP domain-containing sensor histidine kinase [Skermanella rosea]UEM07385.1 HAMP domain-containing histidine kinase [Skermanella rosea]
MPSLIGLKTLIPPSLQLPALAAAMVFVVAVGSTQVALQVMNSRQTDQLRQIGQVYLDGLAASVRPYVEAGDAVELERRFAQALAEQHGIPEQALFAFGGDGRLIARAGDPRIGPPDAAELMRLGFRIDPAGDIGWASRPLGDPGAGAGPGIVAALDLSEVIAARERLLWAVVLMDFVIACLCGTLAFAILQRLSRPLRTLVDHLGSQPLGEPEPLPVAAVGTAGPETRRLFDAYNRLAEGVRDRERLIRALADREQAAALGRMAATMAHEVRNPLGGLATAVSTLRRFGDDRQVRDEALGLLDRGIGTIDRIVTGTLDLYRPPEDRRLCREDLEDLRHLVAPEAVRRGVTLDWRVEVADSVELGAVEVRQLLLNLLLNACAATPGGGKVSLAARTEGTDLICDIVDQGPGLDRSVASRLTGGGADRPVMEGSGRRLGIDVVVALLGSLDGRATVIDAPGRGTSIRIAIPLGAKA